MSKHVNGIETLFRRRVEILLLNFRRRMFPLTDRRADEEMYRVKTMYKKRREEEAGRKAPVG